MPKQLDAELIDQTCRRICETGEYPQRVLVHLGASGAQARRWLKLGEEADLEGMVDPGSLEESCLALVRGVDFAEAEWERRTLVSMGQSIEKSAREGRGTAWQGYMTRLERRFPDRYKRVQAEKTLAKTSAEDVWARLEKSESSTQT